MNALYWILGFMMGVILLRYICCRWGDLQEALDSDCPDDPSQAIHESRLAAIRHEMDKEAIKADELEQEKMELEERRINAVEHIRQALDHESSKYVDIDKYKHYGLGVYHHESVTRAYETQNMTPKILPWSLTTEYAVNLDTWVSGFNHLIIIQDDDNLNTKPLFDLFKEEVAKFKLDPDVVVYLKFMESSLITFFYPAAIKLKGKTFDELQKLVDQSGDKDLSENDDIHELMVARTIAWACMHDYARHPMSHVCKYYEVLREQRLLREANSQIQTESVLARRRLKSKKKSIRMGTFILPQKQPKEKVNAS